MKFAVLLLASTTLFALHTLRVDAGIVCSSDDFNDNSRATNLWGEALVFEPGDMLLETNGRLEFRGTEAAAQPYVRSHRSYNRNWEVITDVGVGSVPLNQPRSHVDMFLAVAHSGDTNLMSGIPGDVFYLSLDLYRDSEGQIERNCEARSYTDWNELEPCADAATASQLVSLRITFDATTKLLTAWYDLSGSADGHNWTALRSVGVNTADSGWQMNSNSTFAVFVGGSSTAFNVTSNHVVYADNFSVCDDLASPRLLLTKGSGTPQVTVQGSVGTHPEIQFANALSTNTSWLTLTNLVLTNNTQTIGDTSASGVPTRFYRARLTP